MNIWLIQRSEPTPQDNKGKQRIMRTGILAERLAAKGHDVIWWTSSFDHYNRVQRFDHNQRVTINDHYQIQYIKSLGYKKNISMSRILDQSVLSKQFNKLIDESKELPDVIVASIPSVEIAMAAVRFGRRNGIPVILDIRDLWPNVFLDIVPKSIRFLVDPLLMPLRRLNRKTFISATGIVGLTRPFVDWALEYAGRPFGENDRVIPMGYINFQKNNTNSQSPMDTAFWENLGIRKNDEYLTVLFLGTIGSLFNIDRIIKAAQVLKDRNLPIRFIICGSGEKFESTVEAAKGLDNFFLPGWIDAPKIEAVLQIADIGIAPYIFSENFFKNIPNKPAEYFSRGLPIALSLNRGPLYDILKERNCGFSYSNDGEELAKELTSLLYDRTRLKEMKENAKTTYLEMFDGEKVYNDYINYLESVSANKLANDKTALYNARTNKGYRFVKRFFDIVFAMIGIIVLSPLMLVIALSILLDNPGPILYKGLRAGQFGMRFYILKFRTMVVNADKGAGTTSKNDSRVTRTGKILRPLKLDELPQLFNVLMGNMSFVGPRPELTRYTDAYKGEERLILTVKPGITDYSSVEFSNLNELIGDADPDKYFEEHFLDKKNQLRIRYVKEQSFLSDLGILFKTVGRVLKIV